MGKRDESRWAMVRIPRELGERLHGEAEAMLRAYQEGRCELPAAYVEKVPLHFVISKALEHMKAKQGRSRAPRRPAASKAGLPGPAPDDATGEGRVYTLLTGEEPGP